MQGFRESFSPPTFPLVELAVVLKRGFDRLQFIVEFEIVHF
jgi:hypothetical protein